MITPNASFSVFVVGDLDKAKSFYSDHFGFTVAFENEWYLHLFSESGVQIGFMLPDQPSQPEVFHASFDGKGVIFSIEVEDAEKAYEEASAKSLDISLELIKEDWGQYHFCVKDPNGLYIDIVEPFEPTEEYQQGFEG